jgi:hypothetical protein
LNKTRTLATFSAESTPSDHRSIPTVPSFAANSSFTNANLDPNVSRQRHLLTDIEEWSKTANLTPEAAPAARFGITA